MPQPRSPREVFLALVNGIADGRRDDLPGLYAEQTDVVHPFDPLRAPALRTRDQLRQHFGHGTARPHRGRPVILAIHETTDPEVIVAEFEYQRTNAETGEPVALPAVFVVRVRDGEIVSSRDYFDHLTAARVRGQPGELFTTAGGPAARPGRTGAGA